MTLKLTPEQQTLIQAAHNAKEQSYSPYSGLQVGAALLASDGRTFTGCNVENASYSACICAERTAMSHAVSQGVRKFSSIAIVSSGPAILTACGVCLQFMSEFAPDLEMLLANNDNSQVHRTSLNEQFTSPPNLEHIRRHQ